MKKLLLVLLFLVLILVLGTVVSEWANQALDWLPLPVAGAAVVAVLVIWILMLCRKIGVTSTDANPPSPHHE